jgi:hypothetical protein
MFGSLDRAFRTKVGTALLGALVVGLATSEIIRCGRWGLGCMAFRRRAYGKHGG